MDHYFTNNTKLKSNPKIITVDILETKLSLITDSGVFSKKQVDFGTKLLLKNLPISCWKGNVLDLGCGYGIIGIFIKKNTNCYVDMVDVNERAVELAKKNIELNCLRDIAVFVSDAYSNVEKKYDYIVTNPPIRAGKTKVLEFLLGSFNNLNENGQLWFVMRKNQGVKSVIKLMENNYNVEIVDKKGGFYIIKVTSL